jgi:hypothetical protein
MYNIFMNKKISIIFTLICLTLLTSCITFTNAPGENSIFDPSASIITNSPQEITYYEGDNFQDTDYVNKITIDCTNNNYVIGKFYSEIDEVLLAMHQRVDTESSTSQIEEINVVVSNIDSFSYVGEGDGGLLIGHQLEKTNGFLSFTLLDAYKAKAVRIHARPRASTYTNYDNNELGLNIDTVALSVNDSDYIKVNNDFNSLSEVTYTTCSYKISDDGASIVSISAYNMQAIITAIDIFY